MEFFHNPKNARSAVGLAGAVWVAGGLAALVGVVVAVSTAWFEVRAKTATGRVVNTTHDSGEAEHVIAFRAGEERHELRAPVDSAGHLQLEDEVEVRYLAGDPDDATIEGFWDTWGLALKTGVFGIVLLGGSWWHTRRYGAPLDDEVRE